MSFPLTVVRTGSLILYVITVYYDRIIAMDDGKVAEFDTPLNLFDNEDSIFRSLCNEAGLSRQDIVRIRTGAVSQVTTEIPSAEGI